MRDIPATASIFCVQRLGMSESLPLKERIFTQSARGTALPLVKGTRGCGGMRHAALAEEARSRNDAVCGPDSARQITYGPGHHDSALGLALFALGDSTRARHYLSSALSILDQGRTRTALQCRIRIAILNLRDDDKAAGETEGYRAISEATGVTSRRIADDLNMLHDYATKGGATELATDLHPLLAS